MEHSTRTRARRTTRFRPSHSLLALTAATLASGFVGALCERAHAQSSGSVARVGRSEIPSREFEEMSRQLEGPERRKQGRDLTDEEWAVFRRQVLEQLIRQRLLRAEAARLGIQVTDAQAEEFLRADPYFQRNGRFDEARWAELSTNPESYRRALRDARDLLAGRRLLDQVRRQVTPPDAELRQHFERRNGRAILNTLLVEKQWFEGGVEISPDRLRAFYDSLVAELPERVEAELELFLVPLPSAASETEARRLAAARADSARRAVERGAEFEAVAESFGGVRSGGVWTTGDRGGLFREDEPLGEAALALPSGSLLPRTLRLSGGQAILRVREHRSSPVPPLADVAPRLIGEVHEQWLEARARAELDSLSAAHPDSFRTACLTWHVALVDTGRVRTKEPSRKDLQRWYEANPTLFAQLDPEGHGVVTPPFEAVEPAVRSTYREALRMERSREVALRIGAAWEKGRRDRKGEEEAEVRYGLRITRQTPPGDLPPELMAAAFGATPGQAVIADADRGTMVFLVVERDTACALPEAEAVAAARGLLERNWAESKEAAARALYDSDPGRFQSQPTYAFTYVEAEARAYEITDFETGAIEAYFEAHKNDFGDPERVRVRHLLVATPPGGDTLAARRRADNLLALARAGAPFDSLVLAHSDEPVTRERAGDSGVLERGTSPAALRPLEDLAFSVRPGDLAGPVRTPYGYHLVEGLEYSPARYQDLMAVRATIGGRIAQERAEAQVLQEVTEAARRFQSREELARWAATRDYRVVSLQWKPGTKALGAAMNPAVQAAFRRMTAPGTLPDGYKVGVNFACVRLDSILPPGRASWNEAREQALLEVESELEIRAALAAAAATREELAAGVPWERAAAPWGGGLESAEYGAGYVIEGLGALAELDTLLFGSPGVALEPGASAVVPTADGAYLVQLTARRLPTDAEFLVARQALRDVAAEHGLHDYFEELKKRYPVRILRADLDMPLPPPPALTDGGGAAAAGAP